MPDQPDHEPVGAPGMQTEMIVQRLRNLIAESAPGDPLPSEPKAAARYAAARGTVREAYARLMNEGLVVKRPHRGYYVRDFRPISWPMSERDSTIGTSPVDPWLTVIQGAGYEGTQIIRVRIVPGDEPVGQYRLSDFMTEADGSPLQRAVVRDRIRKVNGHPEELARSYYPYILAEGTPLVDEADIQPSTYHLLAAKGHHQLGFEDRVRALFPTEQQRTALAIEGLLPVIEDVRTVHFTPGDRILLVRHSVMLGGPDKELHWKVWLGEES